MEALLDTVAEKVDALQLRQAQLAEQLVANASDLVRAREAAMEGREGADEEVAELKAKADVLAAELNDTSDDLAAPATVTQRTGRSIEKVLVTDTTDFVRWAGAYSVEAERRIADLLDAYTAAVNAWSEAQAAWRPLTIAAGLGEVPPCPLPPVVCR